MAKSPRKVTSNKTAKRASKVIKGNKRHAASSLSQVRNSATGHFILRDASSGKFVSSGRPFVGIRTVKSAIKSNPSINKKIAKNAERAVLQVKRRKK